MLFFDRKFDEHEDETEHLQQPQNDPYQDLETAYVAQMCLTWEALHCQYTQLSQRISCQPENPTSYNHSAQQFQQFQVLLQRFIENEPFEQGLRAEVFARSRRVLPRLLQVIESSILTFHLFVKMSKGWKKKTWPQSYEDVQLLFGLVDIKIVSRVLRMIRISKEQLIWCEDKMKKLNLAGSKLQRDPSPILFPC
ncbi:unnamed protein product [Linum tenue]|uniref:Uncharacterized protein n=1 Tax=Linum tenue TaxID=586396 RepID=A0AAV0JJE3_9ROSI|nr:unnamed protein product [Linum tenue]